jgi:hypothetical protein
MESESDRPANVTSADQQRELIATANAKRLFVASALFKYNSFFSRTFIFAISVSID